jgi:aspartate racemase
VQTIGVLGGLGPQATMDFEARIHQISQQLIPQQANQGYPPMLVYYYRHAPVIANEDGTPVFPIQTDPRLLEAARRLGSWADFLVITSNGVHLFQEQIEQAAGRKVLSMIEATLAEVKRRRLARVGVLGLFEPRVYRVPLAQLGIACETIEGDLQKRLDQAIWAVAEGRADETRAVAREAVAALRARNVEAIILGCTEIPFMLPEADSDPTLINPTQLLAEATVRAAME